MEVEPLVEQMRDHPRRCIVRSRPGDPSGTDGLVAFRNPGTAIEQERERAGGTMLGGEDRQWPGASCRRDRAHDVEATSGEDAVHRRAGIQQCLHLRHLVAHQRVHERRELLRRNGLACRLLLPATKVERDGC
jgi:hypothetical protein